MCTPNASRVTSSIRFAATAATSSTTRWRGSTGRVSASLLYLAQEGRGIGLLNKLRAYELQETGLDTVEANVALGFPPDAREYGIGSQILADLGLTSIRVLTNNPKKLDGITGFGLEVVGHEPVVVVPNDENRRYLEAKREKMGHLIGEKLHHQGWRYEPEHWEGAEA